MSPKGTALLPSDKEGLYLSGKLLIATPAVQDSCFNKSVIYMCAHNESGAMGVIVNQPIENLHIREIMEQLDIETGDGMRDMPVHFGGPVDSNRGFVLHSGDVTTEGSLVQPDGIALTANVAILREMADGKGPQQSLLMLGYAGWASGQLESEIESGSWIVVPAVRNLVFESENEMKWSAAAATLGIDLSRMTTGQVGHA